MRVKTNAFAFHFIGLSKAPDCVGHLPFGDLQAHLERIEGLGHRIGWGREAGPMQGTGNAGEGFSGKTKTFRFHGKPDPASKRSHVFLCGSAGLSERSERA
jgi:hypothetical protein